MHATDILTRGMTGGEVVQTFTTVAISGHEASATSHAPQTAASAWDHLRHTWQQLGVPDVAQCDNASACSGGRHPWGLGTVVRLGLSMGIDVLFLPLGAAEYHAPIATFNPLWAPRVWRRHPWTRRRDMSRVQRTLLAWSRRQDIAPRQPETPERMRQGARLRPRASRHARGVPPRVPIGAGRVPAGRRVSPAGRVRLLHPSLRGGKRSHERYVWRT